MVISGKINHPTKKFYKVKDFCRKEDVDGNEIGNF